MLLFQIPHSWERHHSPGLRDRATLHDHGLQGQYPYIPSWPQRKRNSGSLETQPKSICYVTAVRTLWTWCLRKPSFSSCSGANYINLVILDQWELSYFIYKIKQILIDYTYPIFSTFKIPFHLIKKKKNTGYPLRQHLFLLLGAWKVYVTQLLFSKVSLQILFFFPKFYYFFFIYFY